MSLSQSWCLRYCCSVFLVMCHLNHRRLLLNSMSFKVKSSKNNSSVLKQLTCTPKNHVFWFTTDTAIDVTLLDVYSFISHRYCSFIVIYLAVRQQLHNHTHACKNVGVSWCITTKIIHACYMIMSCSCIGLVMSGVRFALGV